MTSFSFRSFCEQKPLFILCFPAKNDDEVDYGADSENTAGQKPQNSRADLPHVKSVNPKTPKKNTEVPPSFLIFRTCLYPLSAI